MTTWRLATLEEVKSILQQEFQHLHPKHRKCFASIQVQPRQVPVTNNPGESVWVIAEKDGNALYWSDAEEGWELEALQEGGVLQKRGCNQFALQHILFQLFGDPELLP
ncbi:MAG: hypothetical protein Q4G39_05695 [Brachymonas sp.]|nr:hypothetical protein [Brachymonas sp.]